MKSCVGTIPLTEQQAQRLELPSHSRISPLLEKCCLRISANESYQDAESEIAALTGMKVGHTRLHRLVQRKEFSLADAKQTVTEVSVDGGKVRLRTQQEQQSQSLEYKAVRLQGVYDNAGQNNLLLIDWVNSQHLVNPLVCLGDGHDGVWKLINELATPEARWEILDWYHLRENLYKFGGSLKHRHRKLSLVCGFFKLMKLLLYLLIVAAHKLATSLIISTSIATGLLITSIIKLNSSHPLAREQWSRLSNRLI